MSDGYEKMRKPNRAEMERIERGREFRIKNLSLRLRGEPELVAMPDDRLRALAIDLMGQYCRPWVPDEYDASSGVVSDMGPNKNKETRA